MIKKTMAVLLAVLLLSGGIAIAEEAPAAEETAEPKKLVALTFDDGPDTLMTAPVLDVLEKYGVKATLFILGCKINEESAPLVERAVELGCEIGCHGFDHRDMSEVSLEQIQKHIRMYREALETYVSVPVEVKLLRPPAGHRNNKVKLAVGQMDMAIVIWDVDSLDCLGYTAEQINRQVLERVKDGSIVLMHDRHQATPDALETLIPALLEQGYEFVTVSEMLTRNGGEIQPGEEYACMYPAD